MKQIEKRRVLEMAKKIHREITIILREQNDEKLQPIALEDRYPAHWRDLKNKNKDVYLIIARWYLSKHNLKIGKKQNAIKRTRTTNFK